MSDGVMTLVDLFQLEICREISLVAWDLTSSNTA